MTSQEYTQWLKGFLDAVDGYNITKKQFDTIREKLKEVNDYTGTPISGWGTVTNLPCTVPYISTGTTSTTFSLTSGSYDTSTFYINGTTTSTTGVPLFNNTIEEESELLLD